MATRGLPYWPFTDMTPEDLPPAELALLDAIRRWGGAVRRREPPLPAIGPILATEGASAAGPALDGLLRAFAESDAPQLGCAVCPRLGGDEPLLLLAVALAQRGRRCEALGLLLRRLPGIQAYAATAAAVALGHHFRAAKLRFGDPWVARPPD